MVEPSRLHHDRHAPEYTPHRYTDQMPTPPVVTYVRWVRATTVIILRVLAVVAIVLAVLSLGRRFGQNLPMARLGASPNNMGLMSSQNPPTVSFLTATINAFRLADHWWHWVYLTLGAATLLVTRRIARFLTPAPDIDRCLRCAYSLDDHAAKCPECGYPAPST